MSKPLYELKVIIYSLLGFRKWQHLLTYIRKSRHGILSTFLDWFLLLRQLYCFKVLNRLIYELQILFLLLDLETDISIVYDLSEQWQFTFFLSIINKRILFVVDSLNKTHSLYLINFSTKYSYIIVLLNYKYFIFKSLVCVWISLIIMFW